MLYNLYTVFSSYHKAIRWPMDIYLYKTEFIDLSGPENRLWTGEEVSLLIFLASSHHL